MPIQAEREGSAGRDLGSFLSLVYASTYTNRHTRKHKHKFASRVGVISDPREKNGEEQMKKDRGCSQRLALENGVADETRSLLTTFPFLSMSVLCGMYLKLSICPYSCPFQNRTTRVYREVDLRERRSVK